MVEATADGRVDARERAALQNLWMIMIDALFLALLLLLFLLLYRFA